MTVHSIINWEHILEQVNKTIDSVTSVNSKHLTIPNSSFIEECLSHLSLTKHSTIMPLHIKHPENNLPIKNTDAINMGVRNISLSGTLKDWENILSLLSYLERFACLDGILNNIYYMIYQQYSKGLYNYIQYMRKIIEQFISTIKTSQSKKDSKSKINLEWWNSMLSF